jgi:thiamine-phosphate pyrophosphorylase
MASAHLQRLWRIARVLQSRQARRRRLPPLWFMTDRARVADPVAAARRLPPGAGVILRDIGMPGRAALAAALAAACRRRRLVFLIAADERLAMAVGADGVHLPERLAARAGRLKARHRGWLVTAAAHGAAALRRAAAADAAFLSPVFPTRSHPGAPHLGPVRFAALTRAATLPVYALGGLDARSAMRLRPARVAGVAAIGAVAAGRPAPDQKPKLVPR